MALASSSLPPFSYFTGIRHTARGIRLAVLFEPFRSFLLTLAGV